MNLFNFPHKIYPALVALFLLMGNILAQKNAEIDYFIQKAQEENFRYNFAKSIDFSLKAYQFSLQKSYEKGIVESQYELAYSHYAIGKFSESLQFLRNIYENHINVLENNESLNLKFTELRGKLYLWTGFQEKSRLEFQQLLKLSSFIEDEHSRNLHLLKAYTLLGINLKDDSSKYYLKKALAFRNKIPNESEYLLTYVNLSRFYIRKQQNIDSASLYNSIAHQIAIKENSRYKFLTTLQLAEIENLKGNQEFALEKAFEALKMAKDQKRGLETLEAYRLIANNYNHQKNFEKEVEYLKIYTHVNDSIYNDIHNDLFNVIIQLESNILNQQKQTNKRFKIFSIGIIFLIFALAFLIYRLLKYRKNTTIKSKIIENKDIEVKSLLTKLQTDKQDDLLEIAQKNPAEFPAKFSEVHKDFIEKLLEIEPNLVSSEITFCAYLRLQFSTKDIANIMYVTPKAIQNRKNRIRKKLNIPSEEDIYVWFSKL